MDVLSPVESDELQAQQIRAGMDSTTPVRTITAWRKPIKINEARLTNGPLELGSKALLESVMRSGP